MEISNPSDAELKTLVKRMLKELSEDLNSRKKIQSEMQDILIETKKNLENYRLLQNHPHYCLLCSPNHPTSALKTREEQYQEEDPD